MLKNNYVITIINTDIEISTDDFNNTVTKFVKQATLDEIKNICKSYALQYLIDSDCVEELQLIETKHHDNQYRIELKYEYSRYIVTARTVDDIAYINHFDDDDIINKFVDRIPDNSSLNCTTGSFTIDLINEIDKSYGVE